MRAAVSLHINAPPDKVWGLISDITKMGEYSPEVIEAEWLDGSTGPAVGARYRGHVKRNENWPVLYWTTCKITESVPGQVFEFAVVMRERPVNNCRNEFRNTEDRGTEVTDSFDLGDNLLTKIWPPLSGSCGRVGSRSRRPPGSSQAPSHRPGTGPLGPIRRHKSSTQTVGG